jgi:O-antigen/teichoic acid export membrane protein
VTRLNSGAHVAETPEAAASYTGRSRMLWTFADQALSSLTNAALAIVVAKSVGKDDFGAFALALLTFTFIVGLVRAFVGEPFVVRFSAANEAERRRGTAHGSGAALTFGALGAVICLGVAALIGGEAGPAFAALAVSLPGLMLQDTWRHMFFAAGRPAAATVNDFVWAVLQFVLLGLLLVNDDDSIFLITLAWGMSALVAAFVGYLQTGIAPSPLATFSWVRETRDISVQLGLGFTLNMGAINFVTYAIGGIVGLAAAGAMRATQTVLGPMNLVFAGFNAFALPMLSRAAAAGDRLLRQAFIGGVTLSGVAAVWVTILVLLPDRAGRAILGDSWAGADRLMLPSGLLLVSVALVLGATNALVALSRADLMLRLTSIQAPLMLILGVVGAWQWGVVAAAYGLLIAQTVGVVAGWVLFIRADADPRRWAVQAEV